MGRLPTLARLVVELELPQSVLPGHLAEGGEKNLPHLDALDFTGNGIQRLEVVRPAFLEVRDPERVVHPLRLGDLSYRHRALVAQPVLEQEPPVLFHGSLSRYTRRLHEVTGCAVASWSSVEGISDEEHSAPQNRVDSNADPLRARLLIQLDVEEVVGKVDKLDPRRLDGLAPEPGWERRRCRDEAGRRLLLR